jgi:hypothetical protein
MNTRNLTEKAVKSINFSKRIKDLKHKISRKSTMKKRNSYMVLQLIRRTLITTMDDLGFFTSKCKKKGYFKRRIIKSTYLKEIKKVEEYKVSKYSKKNEKMKKINLEEKKENFRTEVFIKKGTLQQNYIFTYNRLLTKNILKKKKTY